MQNDKANGYRNSPPSWLRPKEIFKTDDYKVFDDKIESNDIK